MWSFCAVGVCFDVFACVLGLFWYFVLLGCAFGRVLFLFFFVVFFVLSRAANSWALIFFLVWRAPLALRCTALQCGARLYYNSSSVALHSAASHCAALHSTGEADCGPIRVVFRFDFFYQRHSVLLNAQHGIALRYLVLNLAHTHFRRRRLQSGSS